MHESSLIVGYWRGNTCAATLARRRCRVIAAPVQHKEAGWGQRSRSLSEREFSCRGSRALRRAGNALGFHRPTGPPRRPWRPSVARNTARRNVLQRGRASPFTTGPSGLQKPVYVLPRRPAVRRSKIAELMYTRQRGTAIEARCGVPCPNPRSALAPARRKETKTVAFSIRQVKTFDGQAPSNGARTTAGPGPSGLRSSRAVGRQRSAGPRRSLQGSSSSPALLPHAWARIAAQPPKPRPGRAPHPARRGAGHPGQVRQ